ncbi:hypothetical protein HELRODRAFT_168935 [Helobdella robusta]|uniref:Uncharacterized protein n=1 Tax=Helobdella robusta TaxID=6412 RepID=T1F157_HELRO|nr:hypothetical protein HELRODRAFT_168935 [Helobdella robusta]ESO09003.1 hypothetical protein HELRODRAFT_168935 [Helobdella robusta]
MKSMIISVFLIFSQLCVIKAKPDFYPYGPANGDSALAKQDDAFTTININFEFPFFGKTFSQIHISTNGIIFFGQGSTQYVPTPFPINGTLSVAAYWVDSDPRMGGDIYYREEFDPAILNQINRFIKSKFVQFNTFTSSWSLIVTFSNVSRFGCQGSAVYPCQNVVNHQTILTSNGIHSFVIFLYDRLEYSNAQIGFNAGDGKRFYQVDYSNTVNISKYALENSNVGSPGEWLFSISDEIASACNSLGMLEIYPMKVLYYGQQDLFISGPCFDESINEVDVKFGNEEIVKCQKEGKLKLKCLTPYFDSSSRISITLEYKNVSYKTFLLSYDFKDSLVKNISYYFHNEGEDNYPAFQWDRTMFDMETVELRGLKQIIMRDENGNLIHENIKFIKKINNTGVYSVTLLENQLNLNDNNGPTASKVLANVVTTRYLLNIFSRVFVTYLANRVFNDIMCQNWYNNEKDTGEINRIKEEESRRNPCQPTVPGNFPEQLNGFSRDDACNPTLRGTAGCFLFHNGAKGCYRSTNNPNNIAVQCCYNSNNMLIVGPPGGGTLDLYDSEKSKWEHFKVDVLPYFQCCIFSDQCDKYYEKRPSVDSRHYVPPRPVPARGDPHFTTMDGTSYEFNPVGEFVYLQVPNTTVQARIKQYVDRNNVPKPASYFAAFAIKIYDDLTLQIEFTATNKLQLKVEGVIWDEESLSLPEVSAVINTTLISLHTITGLSFQFYNLNNMIHVITALQPSLKGQVSGLIGNWDDDPSNDFMLPNGTWIPKTSSPEDIHFKFGMSWATTERTSIFSYPDGLKWSDYRNSNFAPFFGQPTNSYPQCGNNSQCIFDAFVTGDVNVGLTNVVIQQASDRQVVEYQQMKKTCISVINILHATVNIQNNSDFTRVSYSIACKPGFVLNGPSFVSCVDGELSGEFGSCSAVSIDLPTTTFFRTTFISKAFQSSSLTPTLLVFVLLNVGMLVGCR